MGSGVSKKAADLMGRLSSKRYQRFLDGIEAYYYFPLAIAKDQRMANGKASLRVRPVSGHIDQAGGLAFGVKNMGNYLVLRVNTLEDNFVLFEFKDGERQELASVSVPIERGVWHEIAVEVAGNTIAGFLGDRQLIIYHYENPVSGNVGLWAKADSVTDFGPIILHEESRQ